MINFIDACKNFLEEKDQNLDILFKNKIISKNTFYKYKKRNPNLKTLIKVCNFLNVSIDYLFELSDTNNFKMYSINQNNFYNNLLNFINNKNISQRKFCQALGFSISNVNRYKNGVLPNLSTLVDIAKFFDCQIDDLLQKM